MIDTIVAASPLLLGLVASVALAFARGASARPRQQKPDPLPVARVVRR